MLYKGGWIFQISKIVQTLSAINMIDLKRLFPLGRDSKSDRAGPRRAASDQRAPTTDDATWHMHVFHQENKQFHAFA